MPSKEGCVLVGGVDVSFIRTLPVYWGHAILKCFYSFLYIIQSIVMTDHWLKIKIFKN